MPSKSRPSTQPALHPEVLETRNLLSLLINAKPTLDIQPDGKSVKLAPHGAYSIIQPATIKVFGTAQPPIGLTATVSIFAEDRNNQIINDGQPLATATPDFLGRYSATVSLPSTIRRDVNYLVAFETVTGSINSNLTINPTTLSGLTGNLGINGTTLRDFTGQVSIADGTVAQLNATIAGTTGTSSPLTAPLTIDAGTTITGITGAISSNGSTTLTLNGGTIVTPGSTITLPGGTTAPTAPLTIPDLTGTLTIPGTPTVNGTIAITGAPLSGGAGTLTFLGNGTIATPDGSVDGLTGTLNIPNATLTQDPGSPAVLGLRPAR